MSITDDLSGQCVCLVLTCIKPYYKARLQQNIKTFQSFQSAGFKVIFLYASPGTDTITQDISGFYHMTVPTNEEYFRLSTKLELAYQYLTKTNCKGILKMDDDTCLQNPDCIDMLDMILPRCDYFGIAKVKIDSGIYYFTDPRFNLEHMKSLSWFLPHELHFFVGSFYWLSNTALQDICKHHLQLPLEDASVGLVIKNNPNLRIEFLPWFEQRFFTWTLDTESKRDCEFTVQT